MQGNTAGGGVSAAPDHAIGIALVWPAIAGLIALYLPSLIDLLRGVWSEPEQMHGPLVLAISSWLIYQNWKEMLACQAKPWAGGWLFFVIGLMLYIVGRSQGILLFEVGSVIWILASLVLLLLGPAALKRQWFPLFFMIFMVPLPSGFVDAVTMPMKMAVSYVAEHLLFVAGYPISRTGVILQIGQYKLLVADACAGLHTLLSLEAMGLLYLNLVRHNSWFRNLILALLIVPISFTANVIRVVILSLITFHLGDEAGQGFLHGFAGMVLFVTALLLITSLDSFLQWIVRRRRARRALAAEGL